MKTTTIILTILTLIILFGCKKSNLFPVSGKLKNLTGLDGCGWVIELDKKDKHGNDKLEPINLNDFNITLEDGQRVKFSYVESNMGSICMVGTTVELKSIRTK